MALNVVSRARDRRARGLARALGRRGPGLGHLRAPGLRQLLHEDLDHRRERHRGQRPEDSEQRAEERHGHDDEEARQVDRLALDLRREDVVLDLLVDEHDREHDQRGRQPLLGPERGHEDEAGDRRAEVRDHVEQSGDHAQRERVARAEDPGGHALRRPGDRRDHDDADRPARDRLGHALPHGEPALVLAGHQHARERPLQVARRRSGGRGR